MQSFGSQALIDRMIGAARLDVNTYEEVERDQNATTQALTVVALASIAAGIGGLREDGFGGLIGGLIAGIVGWAVFSFFVYIVGTRLLATAQTEGDTGQVLRTMGFAYTPQILTVVNIIPVLGPIVSFFAFIWAMVTSVVAVRHALEMSTLRAIATILIAGIAMVFVMGIIGAILGVAIWGFGG
jgi:hypothetical protein